ncbi:MAG: hypothetical protein MZV70_03000 [Desulfobacterales bacterium]|nr:hypothetical protein [Desulfobacterales bacterium]
MLAEPVFAAISAPSYHAAAMDGVAVKAETTYGASEAQPQDARGRAARPFSSTPATSCPRAPTRSS